MVLDVGHVKKSYVLSLVLLLARSLSHSLTHLSFPAGQEMQS